MGEPVIFDDLEAELDRLEAILAGLDDAAWRSPSAAPGWSVTDVMLHLAQTEEGVVATIAAPAAWAAAPAGTGGVGGRTDGAPGGGRAGRAGGGVRALAGGPARRPRRPPRTPTPTRKVAWAAWPLKPATLATTRIAEHWAHALDIVEPLAIPFPDTDRLRHIAWLGPRLAAVRLRPAGEPARPVRCELTAPDGVTVWTFGPAGRRVGDHRRRRRLLPGGRAAADAGGLGPGDDRAPRRAGGPRRAAQLRRLTAARRAHARRRPRQPGRAERCASASPARPLPCGQPVRGAARRALSRQAVPWIGVSGGR